MQRVHQHQVRDKPLGGVLRLYADIHVAMLTPEFRQYVKMEGVILVPRVPYVPAGHGFIDYHLIDYHNTTDTVRPPFFTPRFSNRLEFDRKPRYYNYLPLGQPKVMPVLPKPADKSL